VATEESTPAERFARIWGGLALVTFLIAAILTWELVRVRSGESPVRGIGVYGAFGPTASAQISLESTDAGTRWRADYPPGTIWVGLPAGDPSQPAPRCHYAAVGADTVTVDTVTANAELREFTYNVKADAFYTIDVTTNPLIAVDRRANEHADQSRVKAYGRIYLVPDAARLKPAAHNAAGTPIGGALVCDIDAPAFQETFTAKRFDVLFAHLIRTDENQPVPTLRFSATIDHADAIQVFGGRSTSSNATELPNETLGTVRYDDVRDESTRDVVLIVIGSLIAFGAAMALEAIRPFVERWAAAKPSEE
jgi:hypothetical protein